LPEITYRMQAIVPRAVTLLNPADVRLRLGAAFDSDRNLGYPERIRLQRCGGRDPLPVE
jgi:hypothetical protein